MKIIPVTGFSGSGKTTFIRALIPLLSRHGTVGTVKHTGHHSMELPKGKDTTVMFEAGARVVAGIDQGKTLITMKGTSLTNALDFLALQGVAFAVVEGYKTGTWPRIVIGDFGAEEVVLRNPAPEDVINVLDRFPDYITIGAILRELGVVCREKGESCTIATATIPLPAEPGGQGASSIREDLPALVRGMESLSGVIGARAGIRPGSLLGETDELFAAVAAESMEEAVAALQLPLPICTDILEEGKTGR